MAKNVELLKGIHQILSLIAIPHIFLPREREKKDMNQSHFFWCKYNFHAGRVCLTISLTGIFILSNPQNCGAPHTHTQKRKREKKKTEHQAHTSSSGSIRSTAWTQEITGSFPFSKMAALFPQHWRAGLEQFPTSP